MAVNWGAIDLSKPRWSQDNYIGRLKHFACLTNPLNTFVSDSYLDEAKKIVDTFKKSRAQPPGVDEEKLWSLKYLVDGAFHPDTGEKLIRVGRMAAQMPMNTLITGCMITFYKSNAAAAFWQWFNQTFNACVNYSNRGGDAAISRAQLLASYTAACTGAVGTALYLNHKVKRMGPMAARLVPFAAVAAANCINVPMMRSNEIINGTPVFDNNDKRLGASSRAAAYGIALVCFCRVLMAVPGMTICPMLTNMATEKGYFCQRAWAAAPFQLSLVALSVLVSTPMCCALFPQIASFPVSSLEEPLATNIKKTDPNITNVRFNKGL